MIEHADLHARLDALSDEFALRLHDAAPDCTRCLDGFEQWRDAFYLARRHIDEKLARDYADATLAQYQAELKTHGILAV